jgi:hypothetical protein
MSSAAGSFQRVFGNVNHKEIVARTPTGTLVCRRQRVSPIVESEALT